MEIYIDCEWTIDQDIFLIGYAYTLRKKGQLYEKNLTKKNFLKLLDGVEFVFVYGPDIGMLEKYFGINIRDKYKCINLLKIFRRYIPDLESYKLADMEHMFDIPRSTPQYKRNIFSLFEDWHDPKKRRLCLKYNMEDVINLLILKKRAFDFYHITRQKYSRSLLR
jgi:DNA polymerase elongation subunit (family B)